MSHSINYSTADKADILAFLGSSGALTDDQSRVLDTARKYARVQQDDLDRQRLDWGLSIPDALDHLLAGHTDSTAECAGNAYHTALQCLIDCNASDPMTLATYSDPAKFFGLLDDELRHLGVPTDLLPYGYLYGGLPDEFPHLPHSVDGYPAIGYLPLAKAKPAADAYRAVLDQLGPDIRYEVQELIDKLDVEHDEWEFSTARVDWYTQDTLFFSLV
ncbi:DUF7691 family protein [Nocardia cyriacigeorgica]|uniref:DUF7691 family protein n=1 Tax=Nocardia cyriacigeorgica TaxID=135487 RepID=UPI00245732A1|nr:hypothetical protein [Nocardia cyriacigeorgica]